MYVAKTEVDMGPAKTVYGLDGFGGMSAQLHSPSGGMWTMEMRGHTKEPFDAARIAAEVCKALKTMGLVDIEDVRAPSAESWREAKNKGSTTKKETDYMNLTTAIFLIDATVRAIAVNYDPNNVTVVKIFKTTDQSIKVDDLVVVTTDTRHKRTVGKVVEVDTDVNYDSDVKYEWIVSKVDETDYKRIIAIEEAKMAEVRKAEVLAKRSELRAKLEVSNPGLFKPSTLLTDGTDKEDKTA